MRIADAAVARRALLATGLLALAPPLPPPLAGFLAPPALAAPPPLAGFLAAPALAADTAGGVSADAAALLQLIPMMPYGAPATNVTLPPAVASEIEARAAALEAAAPRNLASDARLSGSWRLRYSNAREITNLAAGLPLGFVLGATYQPVDSRNGVFENQGTIEHSLGLFRASTRVVGDCRVAAAGSVNAAGVVNERGNRVDTDFRRIVFGLDEPARFRKIIAPKLDPAAPQTAIDITYLDGDASMRVTRGGDGSLFVLARADDGPPMLTAAEREELYAEGGAEARRARAAPHTSTPPVPRPAPICSHLGDSLATQLRALTLFCTRRQLRQVTSGLNANTVDSKAPAEWKKLLGRQELLSSPE